MNNSTITSFPRILSLAVCLSVGGCGTLGYYGQTVAGHMEVLQSRRPIEVILKDEQTPTGPAEKLRFIQELLDFAHARLALPDNGSYRHYADLDRRFVTWNVFAAPELSLQPRRWCYLFVGCLSYRGYFTREHAIEHAGELKRQGLDVYIGGVRAYSTLGWFRDPVLNTMLDLEDWETARLIFHELAHQKLYIRGLTDVNEAFAESVARIGLDLWLRTLAPERARRIRSSLRWEDAFYTLVLEYTQRLGTMYRSAATSAAKRQRKGQLLDALQEDYRRLKHHYSADDRFDRWILHDLNNGKLVAVSTYRRLVPEFMAIYAATGENLAGFYDYVESLRNCDARLIRERLQAYRPGEDCKTGNTSIINGGSGGPGLSGDTIGIPDPETNRSLSVAISAFRSARPGRRLQRRCNVIL